jgi:hypothetical protein
LRKLAWSVKLSVVLCAHLFSLCYYIHLYIPSWDEIQPICSDMQACWYPWVSTGAKAVTLVKRRKPQRNISPTNQPTPLPPLACLGGLNSRSFPALVPLLFLHPRAMHICTSAPGHNSQIPTAASQWRFPEHIYNTRDEISRGISACIGKMSDAAVHFRQL